MSRCRLGRALCKLERLGWGELVSSGYVTSDEMPPSFILSPGEPFLGQGQGAAGHGVTREGRRMTRKGKRVSFFPALSFGFLLILICWKQARGKETGACVAVERKYGVRRNSKKKAEATQGSPAASHVVLYDATLP